MPQVLKITIKLAAYWMDYAYFKMIVVELSKLQALDAETKVIQKINSTEILDRAGDVVIFFMIKRIKEIILGFSQRIMKYCHEEF